MKNNKLFIRLIGIFVSVMIFLPVLANPEAGITKIEPAEVDTSPPTFSEPLDAAKANLKDLINSPLFSHPQKEIAGRTDTQANAEVALLVKLLGFESEEELISAEIGRPYRLYEIPTKNIEKFMEGDDPNNLLVDTHLFLFPLLAKKHVRSILTVGQVPGKGWRVVSQGKPELARLLELYGKPDFNLLVAMSSLGLQFLGAKSKNELVLVSLQQIITLDLPPGQNVPAKKIFTLLSDDLKSLHKDSESKVPAPDK